MQTIGPYALQDVLGAGPAGRIWRAVDQQGNRVSLALLEGPAAGDQQLRARLTGAVEQLRTAQPPSTPFAADLAGPQPWVAYPDDGGASAANLFAALGAPCTPSAPAAAQPAAGGMIGQPASGAPAGLIQQPGAGLPSGPPMPEQAQPAPDNQALDPFNPAPPAPAEPVNPFAPQPPVSAAPTQFSPAPQGSGSFPQQPSPPAAQYPPADRFGGGDEPPRRRHTLLFVGIGVLVLLLVGGGIASALYLGRDSGTPKADTSSKPTPAASQTHTASSAPTPHTQKSAPSKPKHPGKEPPKDGSWPASFAKFGSKDKTQKLSKLAGLGFTLIVPEDWGCTKKDQSTSYVNYHCGNDSTKAGGDVIVRTCSEPCTAAKKIHMREQEEAWGLRWVRDGGNCSWAQSSAVPGADGKDGYGLVMVRYWHSKPGGPMDRELVLRLTAPTSHAKDVQQVANAARDATQ